MLDFTPFLDHWLYPLLAVLLTGLVGWIVVRSTAWIDAHASFLDAETRKKIAVLEQQALNAGADYLISAVQKFGGQIHFSVDNPMVRWAAQLAINHSAGTLADHGASPDEVATKILVLLPPIMVTTDTTGAILMPPEKITVLPLPDLTPSSNK